MWKLPAKKSENSGSIPDSSRFKFVQLMIPGFGWGHNGGGANFYVRTYTGQSF